MTSREMFHQMLNSRSNPQRAYAILSNLASVASNSDKSAAALALAPIIREAKTRQQREALLDDLKGDTEA